MVDPQDLLVRNLIEALSQLERYTVLGLGSSISALVLSRPVRYGGTDMSVTVPGTFVAIDRELARTLLLAFCVLMGAMGSYAATSVNAIGAGLGSPALLAAACSYPTVGSSPYVGVRFIAALLPLVLAGLAVIRGSTTEAAGSWRSKLLWFSVLVPSYGATALALQASPCPTLWSGT